ncbi:hypothetical protein QOT17_011647 [Balamuthia mandrillaris]
MTEHLFIGEVRSGTATMDENQACRRIYSVEFNERSSPIIIRPSHTHIGGRGGEVMEEARGQEIR